jgi:DNA-binding helix-hairpin-helix protein with protein kinase domain
MNLYTPNPKTNIQLAPTPFAAGGESELYNLLLHRSVSGAELPNFTNLVAKVLLPNKRSLDKRRKIEYLIANAPDNQANAHPDVIWAKYILEDERGEFVGYLMDKAEGEKLELLCTNKIPKPFLHKWGRFALDLPESRLLRLKICYNLCIAVEKMHRKGYVLADLKPENVMIQPDGRVSVIDTDSVQVVENQKILFPVNVATPEYTPAESYHTAQLSIDKRIISKTWDEFSIAVIQYRILFGIHPFTATSTGRYEHCTDLQQKIKCGLFVHSPNHQAFMSNVPNLHALFKTYPAPLQDYFCASLSANPAERLPLPTWIPMLQKVISSQLSLAKSKSPIDKLHASDAPKVFYIKDGLGFQRKRQIELMMQQNPLQQAPRKENAEKMSWFEIIVAIIAFFLFFV